MPAAGASAPASKWQSWGWGQSAPFAAPGGHRTWGDCVFCTELPPLGSQIPAPCHYLKEISIGATTGPSPPLLSCSVSNRARLPAVLPSSGALGHPGN